MRSGSTPARTSEAFGNIFGNQLKAELALYYKKDGEWNFLDDLDEENGVTWGAEGQKFDYSAIALVPAASPISFQVLNFQGKFSPGSTTPYDGVFDLDTPVKLQAGYQLPELGDEIPDNLTLLEGAYGYHYFSKTLNGSLIRDVTNSIGNSNRHFTDIPGSFGYYVSTFAYAKRAISQTNRFSVTADNSNLTIYWRDFDNRGIVEQNTSTTSDWNSAGNTVNGTKNVFISSNKKYIQIAVVFEGAGWADGLSVTNLGIIYQTYVEWIYKSVYYLDSAEYDDPTAPEIPRINCAGRDLMKRALDSDINLQDLSSGIFLDALLKSLLDQLNMKYTATSITDLTSFGLRTLASGLSTTVKALTVIELIMQIITQSGAIRYFIFIRYDETIDDNAIFVQIKPDSFIDFMVFSRDFVSQIGFKRKSYDRLLQRMTIVTKKEDLAANDFLGGVMVNASGNYTVSWTGNAEYKYYKIDVPSAFDDVSLFATNPVNPTSTEFTVNYSGTPFNILVYGSRWKTTQPIAQGEAINNENMIKGRGITRELANPMILDDLEARNIAQGFLEDYGNPAFDVGDVGWPFLNVFFDQNDPALIVSNITFIANIYYINTVSHTWTRATDSSTFSLIDSGFTLADFPGIIIYDSIGHYDSGEQYDLNFPLTQTSDNTNYNYLKPLIFA